MNHFANSDGSNHQGETCTLPSRESPCHQTTFVFRIVLLHMSLYGFPEVHVFCHLGKVKGRNGSFALRLIIELACQLLLVALKAWNWDNVRSGHRSCLSFSKQKCLLACLWLSTLNGGSQVCFDGSNTARHFFLWNYTCSCQ